MTDSLWSCVARTGRLRTRLEPLPQVTPLTSGDGKLLSYPE